MIALDENMVGIDDDSIIVQGLQSCLALFCKTGNNQLIGVHFTTGNSIEDMSLIMTHIRNISNNITWIAMVGKLHYWEQAISLLITKEKLAAFFRTQLRSAQPLYYINFQNAAPSFDIKCTNGITPSLSYRPTPAPNPTNVTPSGNVFGVRKPQNVLVATNAGAGNIMHCMPQNTGGFIGLNDNIEVIQ
jgi:hypothetical protein